MIDFDALVLRPAYRAFAKTARYHPRAGEAFNVRVIDETDGYSLPMAQGAYATLVAVIARKADLPAVPAGDELELGSVRYSIRAAHAETSHGEGTGELVLELQELDSE